ATCTTGTSGLSYAWEWTPWSAWTYTDPTTSYTPSVAGSGWVILTVTDDDGGITTLSKWVEAVAANNPPTAEITLPTADSSWTPGGMGFLYGGVIDTDGGTVQYRWYLDGTLLMSGNVPVFPPMFGEPVGGSVPVPDPWPNMTSKALL